MCIRDRCIPGCEEFVKNSDTSFTVTATNKIGPFNATFKGDIELQDLKPPDSYRIVGQGNSPVGFASGEASVQLNESNGITKLTYSVEANVGGKIAQLGSRLIDMTAKKMADIFFGKFSGLLSSPKNMQNKKEDTKIISERSIDLKKNNKISAYIAKDNAPILYYDKINSHKVTDFWDTIKTKDDYLIIKPGKFYILKSKQKIRIPKTMAGEMKPYDTGIGDFRVHYAGFFDPGFGDPFGSYAVLEVKTNEVPFILHDGQVIAKIQYEKLNKETKVVYGSNIKSNYQNQKLALSKHFEVLRN